MMVWECGWDDREQNRHRAVGGNPTAEPRKSIGVDENGQKPK
jgi:hypothetical protein